MRGRWGVVAALLFVPCLAGSASAVGVAVGGFGGWNIPILQDDAGGGALYGAKAKIGGLSLFVLEPSVTWISLGESEQTEEDLTFKQEGGSIQSFGLNVSIGGFRVLPGPGFYVTGGVGSYTLKPDVDYKDEETRIGFNGGLGIVVKPHALFDIDVSGRLIAIPLDGGGSRKSVGLLAGLNFYFGS